MTKFKTFLRVKPVDYEVSLLTYVDDRSLKLRDDQSEPPRQYDFEVDRIFDHKTPAREIATWFAKNEVAAVEGGHFCADVIFKGINKTGKVELLLGEAALPVTTLKQIRARSSEKMWVYFQVNKYRGLERTNLSEEFAEENGIPQVKGFVSVGGGELSVLEALMAFSRSHLSDADHCSVLVKVDLGRQSWPMSFSLLSLDENLDADLQRLQVSQRTDAAFIERLIDLELSGGAPAPSFFENVSPLFADLYEFKASFASIAKALPAQTGQPKKSRVGSSFFTDALGNSGIFLSRISMARASGLAESQVPPPIHPGHLGFYLFQFLNPNPSNFSTLLNSLVEATSRFSSLAHEESKPKSFVEPETLAFRALTNELRDETSNLSSSKRSFLRYVSGLCKALGLEVNVSEALLSDPQALQNILTLIKEQSRADQLLANVRNSLVEIASLGKEASQFNVSRAERLRAELVSGERAIIHLTQAIKDQKQKISVIKNQMRTNEEKYQATIHSLMAESSDCSFGKLFFDKIQSVKIPPEEPPLDTKNIDTIFEDKTQTVIKDCLKRREELYKMYLKRSDELEFSLIKFDNEYLNYMDEKSKQHQELLGTLSYLEEFVAENSECLRHSSVTPGTLIGSIVLKNSKKKTQNLTHSRIAKELSEDALFGLSVEELTQMERELDEEILSAKENDAIVEDVVETKKEETKQLLTSYKKEVRLNQERMREKERLFRVSSFSKVQKSLNSRAR